MISVSHLKGMKLIDQLNSISKKVFFFSLTLELITIRGVLRWVRIVLTLIRIGYKQEQVRVKLTHRRKLR